MSTTTAPQVSQFPPLIAEVVRQSMRECLGPILACTPQEVPDVEAECSGPGVVAMISMVGDPSWTMGMSLPEATARDLIEKFCGFAIPFDSPDMGDAMGELVNVIGGDLVGAMEARGVKSHLSLPVVTRGVNVEVMLPVGSPSMKLSYSCPQGKFLVKLATARAGHSVGRRPGT